MKTIFLVLILSSTAVAQSALVPIVELRFGGLLGGVQNGRWVAPTKVTPKMPAETEFVLVGLQGVEEGGVSLGRKQPVEDVCPDFTRVELELKQERGVAIGSVAKWRPAPRIARVIDVKNPVYIKVVTSFLKRKGIARPTVRITQAYRVDLDADGTDEVLLAANYYRNGLASSAEVGDYSFVIVRKAIGRVVTDHLLTGDFVLKKIDFGAPTENHISAIADLNGDGRMEIVLHGSYYEGDFASAFEMKGGRPVKIKEFEIGCGV